ncbi:MAG: WD40 repeat domain-containing protein [Cyanobacteria bacterium J06634_5]
MGKARYAGEEADGGGLPGDGWAKRALNERAETVYNSLREVDKPWAKRVCLRLVRVGVGEKDTRQRQPKELLLAMGGPEASPNEQQRQTRQVIADVIQALVAGRLLVGDGDYVDLAHEALLDGWVRFAAWRQEDRDLRRLEQRMGDEYESWKSVKETDEKDENEYLLKGGLLAEVREQWEALSKRLAESRPALMKYFVDSDRKEKETVVMLQRALANADMQAESLRVHDTLLNNPAQTVESTLSAVALIGKSQQIFQGEVVVPAQDALHFACSRIRECLRLEGYIGSTSVAFSPQGDRIVSGNGDTTLQLWDLEGNAIGPPFEGHSGSVKAVAFSPQGDCIVSGSADRTLRLWDLERNAIGLPFEGHSGSVEAVAFSPQGDCIVSGSADRTLRLWNLEGHAVGSPFKGHSGFVQSVAFSPQGDCIVSGSNDGMLLWDLEGNAVGSPRSTVTATRFGRWRLARREITLCQVVWTLRYGCGIWNARWLDCRSKVIANWYCRWRSARRETVLFRLAVMTQYGCGT